MSTQDFKKGMVAASNVFAEKEEQLKDANNRVVEKVSEKIDSVGSVINIVIDDVERQDNILTSIEKKRLYDLNTIIDIKEHLDESEQEFLLALLFELSDDQNNENQKHFIRSVKAYLEIKEHQTSADISCVENIQKVSSQKAILQTIMEFLFLKNENFDFFEESTELFDCFNVNKKTITEIRVKIQEIYNATGSLGLSEKYGYVAIEENIEEELKHIEESAQEIELTEHKIDSILNIGESETKTFKNKIIHISAFINCKGILEFENCIIYYNKTHASDEIILSENATLKFTNCQIECKGIDESPFIKGESNNIILFINCELVNCSYFVKTDSDSVFAIEGCNIINPSKEFLDANIIDGKIIDSTIEFVQIDAENENSTIEDSSFDFFVSRNYKNNASFLVKNCKVTSTIPFNPEEKSSNLFYLDNATYENCSFTDITGRIINGNNIQIINSEFNNCESIFSSQGKYAINECRFENCTNILSAISSDEGTIMNCQFINCYDKIISASGVEIEFCEFFNISYKLNGILPYSLEFERINASRSSSLKKCIFNGFETEQGFLIGGLVNKDHIAVYIEDCNFINCKTGRESGKIIKEWGYYKGTFGKAHEPRMSLISNCKGLDNINKSIGKAKDLVIKSKTNNGVQIGAQLAGFVLGGPLGAYAGKRLADIYKKMKY